MNPPTHTRTTVSSCDAAGTVPVPIPCAGPLVCPTGDTSFDFVTGEAAVHIVGGDEFAFAPLCAGLSISVSTPLPATLTIAACPGNPAQVCISYNGGAASVWTGNIIVGNGEAPPCTLPYTITIAP